MMFALSAMEKEGMMRLPALIAKEQELSGKQEGLLSEYSRQPALAGLAMAQAKFSGTFALGAEEQAGFARQKQLRLMFLQALWMVQD
jgi:hypothetical protein